MHSMDVIGLGGNERDVTFTLEEQTDVNSLIRGCEELGMLATTLEYPDDKLIEVIYPFPIKTEVDKTPDQDRTPNKLIELGKNACKEAFSDSSGTETGI